MAIKKIKTVIGGRSVATCVADMGAAEITAIQALTAGITEVYDLTSSGGTAASMPATLNNKKFSVSRKNASGSYQSGSFNVPHLKTTKNAADVISWGVGVLDAGFHSTLKAEKVSVRYAK